MDTMMEACRPTGDQDTGLSDLEGFFDDWVVDNQKLSKKLVQDGRTFLSVVAPSRVPGRWLWQLFDVVWGDDCLVLEGFAPTEEAAKQLCLLALVVVLSDDRAAPLTERRADYYLYAV